MHVYMYMHVYMCKRYLLLYRHASVCKVKHFHFHDRKSGFKNSSNCNKIIALKKSIGKFKRIYRTVHL